jgi:putative flavoprotein involved in K+ transport
MPTSTASRLPTVVIGAGQAGLAVSHELTTHGVEHVVLDAGRVGQTWRGRWQSFTLVTPSWSLLLPGFEYAGAEPDGFLPRDEVVQHLADYAASFGAPVHEGVAVRHLGPGPDGTLQLTTSDGSLVAGTAVVATGAYQRPHRPVVPGALPAGVEVLDSTDYVSPGGLPEGAVLVVGSGQTGCQLAEDLLKAGREVFLACGRAPWLPRQLGGEDIVTWLCRTSFMDTPLAALPHPGARLWANFQLTGRDGGHDLNCRTLQAAGVQLAGHLESFGEVIRFADDLADCVAFGDARYADVRALFRTELPARGLTLPDLPDPEPFVTGGLTELRAERLGAVVFTSGFRPDYRSWVDFPVFDDVGFPVSTDGSTAVPGLYFCGVHFMSRRSSALFMGVGKDASRVASAVSTRLGL